jgi:hypothetical protein
VCSLAVVTVSLAVVIASLAVVTVVLTVSLVLLTACVPVRVLNASMWLPCDVWTCDTCMR